MLRKANIDDTRYVPQVAAVAFLLRGKTRPRQTNAAFLIKKSRKAFETGEEEQHWKGNKFHTIIYVFHPSLGTLRGLALLCLCACEIERKASRWAVKLSTSGWSIHLHLVWRKWSTKKKKKEGPSQRNSRSTSGLPGWRGELRPKCWCGGGGGHLSHLQSCFICRHSAVSVLTDLPHWGEMRHERIRNVRTCSRRPLAVYALGWAR